MFDRIHFFGHKLPHCPKHWHVLTYPSVSVIFGALSLVSFIFALIITLKYNSVRVFNKKIRTPNISNTWWIFYYLVLGLQNVCNTIQFALGKPKDKELDSILWIISLFLNGCTAFALCLALNHQKKYRSSHPPPVAGDKNQESNPLLPKYWIRKSVGAYEILFVLLLIIYSVLIYFASTRTSNLYNILFLCSFGLQRIPIAVLVLAIILHKNAPDGPTNRSKIYLLVATALHISGDLPLSFWAYILPSYCIFVFSWVDIIHVLYFISLLFFFFFIRSEYLRNQEECIWNTVSQIQDTLDFKSF